MTKDQKRIIEKHWINPLSIQNTGKQPRAISKMMDEYTILVLEWVMDKEYNFEIANVTAKDLYNKFKTDNSK